ncbi:HD domain-containing protein [Psychromonas sp. RZ22]|uniref:HD domain-containing protein n=1 Tax=Psychromonas algarum TaxID=2555643 RepID=UPI001068C7EA|nr:HD domain-containing protein [Psychromonas sp. RZ22]TEW53482.1 HD domain-containing protein [Psychromonas sp. RZ22]
MFNNYQAQCEQFIRINMKTDLAHDLLHVKRVVCLAKKIADIEHAELNVVLPAAWLHDCVSYPKNDPSRAQSSLHAADKAVLFLQSINYPEKYLSAIHHAIVAHSVSGGLTAMTIEAQVVQDADRLDALGAIGVSRCIQVSSQLKRMLYSEDDPFAKNRALDDQQFTLDHFYQKLLKLADAMNTSYGKKLASKRTEFMKAYIQQLASEIECEY